MDWHQWMGPDRTATWYHGPGVDTLTTGMVEPIWEADVGPGYSGPTVADGRIYIMDYAAGSERVLCIDAEHGTQIWSFAYPVEYNVGYPTGPRASVQVFNGKAYSLGTMGHIYCFDAVSGRIIWQINALETYRSRIPTWGLASNPIMVNGKFIVQLGGTPDACMVAFDKDTGDEIWRALPDEASYSTPVLIEQAGEQVLVCWTGERIAGLDPDNGNIFWSVPFKPENMIMNVASPVYDPPYLFCSAFFDGSYLLELDQQTTSARIIYHRAGENERNTDALHCCISTPLIIGEFVYGIDSYGETRCLRLATGDRQWEDITLVPEGRWANVHLISEGNKVWGFNEVGELLLGEFSPLGYRDLGRVKVIDPVKVSPNPRNGVCWAHPAFSGNRIFLRSDAKLVCIAINNL
jgi:outer membrane protein assembly factor BamB